MDENAILKKNILSFSKLNTISEDEIKNIYQSYKKHFYLEEEEEE